MSCPGCGWNMQTEKVNTDLGGEDDAESETTY